jgi:uncharacterized protein (DUF58 family)
MSDYTLRADRGAGAPLLDPAFVRELEALRRKLEIRARSGQGGDHLSRRRGSSVEFREHRGYAPGDDLRRIDWSAYARTGEPVLKLFRAEEDVIARILCDTSASMDFGSPTKLAVAKRLAAAIGYMVLSRSERAQLLTAADGVQGHRAPFRGRSGLPKLLRELESVTASGTTNLARAVDDVVRRSERPGMLVVLSDFFDASPLLTSLKQAAFAGHQIALLQVLTPEEIEPDLEGDLALVDAETGESVDITLDERALEAYLGRLAALQMELSQFARRHAAYFATHGVRDDLREAVRAFVERRRLP